jgi:hypothetical protein
VGTARFESGAPVGAGAGAAPVGAGPGGVAGLPADAPHAVTSNAATIRLIRPPMVGESAWRRSKIA